jgi:hypothetical protein
MATFEVTVSFHFDTTYKVEAKSYEEAEELALAEAEEWKPYSSDKGVTYDWCSVDIENCFANYDFVEDEEDE